VRDDGSAVAFIGVVSDLRKDGNGYLLRFSHYDKPHQIVFELQCDASVADAIIGAARPSTFMVAARGRNVVRMIAPDPDLDPEYEWVEHFLVTGECFGVAKVE